MRWLLGAVFLLSSCSLDVEKDHHEAVVHGYKKLPIAESLEKKFGAWSFITHWNIKNDPKYGFKKNEKKWQSLTYIYGRYKVLYAQPVILEKNGGKVKETARPPKLYLSELSRIYGDPDAPSGRYSDFQQVIEGERLKKLIASNWDFKSIGIDLKKDSPLDNIEWEYNYWNRIYPLQKQAYEK